MAKNQSRYRVDWADLKLVLKHLLSGNGSDFKNSTNKRLALEYVKGGSWDGFTQGQLERWVSEGFQTEAIHGLEDFIPPIREKRKFVFAEEGDEFHLDMALSGMDNFYSKFTKRDEIPGLAIDAEIGMAASVNASVLNAYYAWLCKVAYAIEAAGIDTEITLHYEMQRFAFQDSTSEPATTVIRVKKEQEISDFLSWSVMLSPASFRCCMFITNCMHAESLKRVCSSSQGQRITGATWDVKFDLETRSLRINCPWSGVNEFPEHHMTAKLREALKEATQKVR